MPLQVVSVCNLLRTMDDIQTYIIVMPLVDLSQCIAGKKTTKNIQIPNFQFAPFGEASHILDEPFWSKAVHIPPYKVVP